MGRFSVLTNIYEYDDLKYETLGFRPVLFRTRMTKNKALVSASALFLSNPKDWYVIAVRRM